ncbi:MAG: excinuclease ABC subunit UvrA [Cellulosilyticum sp.]|nr:excinuclease ABC subunit UvrA [Cellulosilyticum sp.]
MNDTFILKGLRENNLKHIDLEIPKHKLVVFTGVSGSGKSSIVFDTIVAEATRQINATYPVYVRSRLPKYEKPKADSIQNLTAVVVVDQKQFSGNARSTVGTMTELSSQLRLLFSRIGEPSAGSASHYSFNNPSGMCLNCSGLGKVKQLDMEKLIDTSKSLAEGAVMDSSFSKGDYLWKTYMETGYFDEEKPLCQWDRGMYNLFLYGNEDGVSAPRDKKIDGLINRWKRWYLNREVSTLTASRQAKIESILTEATCPICQGARLNEGALASKINDYNIVQLGNMEIEDLVCFLENLKSPTVQTALDTLILGLRRIIDIGLGYLHLNRDATTLSGGEAQRLKMVRYLGSSLTDMTYIFDEPSTGLHPNDVMRLNKLLLELRDQGNNVLVVEHDKDVIYIADEVIDVGPKAGIEGGNIVFQGSVEALKQANTLTGQGLNHHIPLKTQIRKPTGFITIQDAHTHNLKHVDVEIPMGVMVAVTGVAGSGKSSLISYELPKVCHEVVKVSQGAITATGRSTPASYLGFMDDIRKLFAKENGVEVGYFSFNSKGGCPDCKGKGVIVTELAFMDPIVTTCEVCEGKRFSKEALAFTLRGKNILEVLDMTIQEAVAFFNESKIKKNLKALEHVGLEYMTLGQPLSTLSGGERQRIKLAKEIYKKGNVYILDEPTTGLHMSDIEKLMKLFNEMVDKGNTVIVIEHNLDVVRQVDYVIDIGPYGGKNGGEVVFTGTPTQLVEARDRSITGTCLYKELIAEGIEACCI